MGRLEAIAHLRAFEPELRALGAEAAFLFGSVSRGEERAQSDIDVLLDIRKDASFTLLDLAAARRFLSEGLVASVDLTTLDDVSPYVRRRILSEAIQIF